MVRSIDGLWEGWLSYKDISMLPGIPVSAEGVSKRVRASQNVFDPKGAMRPDTHLRCPERKQKVYRTANKFLMLPRSPEIPKVRIDGVFEV